MLDNIAWSNIERWRDSDNGPQDGGQYVRNNSRTGRSRQIGRTADLHHASRGPQGDVHGGTELKPLYGDTLVSPGVCRIFIRRGAGVVERDGLENRCTLMRTEGSNPSLSAIQSGLCAETRGSVELFTRIQEVTAVNLA